MRRVDCIGMVGKFPTPKGLVMFWDTGRLVSPVDFAEIIALQHSAFSGSRNNRRRAMAQVYNHVSRIAHEVNVWPIGIAAVADDGRILVTEPWFEEK